MSNLSKFGERLSELIFEAKIDNQTLCQAVGVDVGTVCRWRRGELDISLSNLIKLADYFGCAIDFVAGRADTLAPLPPRVCPPFYEALRRVMRELGVSRYRLVKDTPIYDSYFTNWKRGVDVQLSTLILLSSYLDCSIDYLIGRE